jgi:hypothetical protein
MFETVGHVAIINLATRTDRRREMQAQLDAVGSRNHTWFEAFRPESAGGFESIGARGCFLSHLEVLRTAIGASSVVILEDDVNFAEDASSRFAEAIAMLECETDWGMFYGSHFSDVTGRTSPLVEVSSDDPLITAAFLVVNGPTIPSLVQYLEAVLSRPPGHPDGGPMHVDGAYWRFRQETACRTFVVVPQLGWQRPSRTDIHALSWYDKTPIVRDAIAFARRHGITRKLRGG